MADEGHVNDFFHSVVVLLETFGSYSYWSRILLVLAPRQQAGAQYCPRI